MQRSLVGTVGSLLLIVTLRFLAKRPFVINVLSKLY